jgi:hypothetical protein
MGGEVITLADAKENLNITGTGHDSKLLNMIRRCEALLFDYLGIDGLDDFYYAHGESGRDVLEQAVLVMVATAYVDPAATPLDRAAKILVRRFRPVVIA